jgi:hypothetical protein
MLTALKLFILSTLALLMVACGGGGDVKSTTLDLGSGSEPVDLRVTALPVVKVNSAKFHSVSVFVYDGLTPENHFVFTLECINVKAGYSVDEFYNRDKKLTVHANWSGRHYVESTEFATHAHFTILSITEQEAVIEVSARLLDPQLGAFLKLPQATLKIQGHDLEALIEKP